MTIKGDLGMSATVTATYNTKSESQFVKALSRNEAQADMEVGRMIEKWDLVKCSQCGKELSMLNARSSEGGSSFTCKAH